MKQTLVSYDMTFTELHFTLANTQPLACTKAICIYKVGMKFICIFLWGVTYFLVPI
jgi:hypothetical protein